MFNENYKLQILTELISMFEEKSLCKTKLKIIKQELSDNGYDEINRAVDNYLLDGDLTILKKYLDDTIDSLVMEMYENQIDDYKENY